MIKVTVIFRHNPVALVFRPKNDAATVVTKLKGAKDRNEQLVAFDTDATGGGVLFDPREAVGFTIEKI